MHEHEILRFFSLICNMSCNTVYVKICEGLLGPKLDTKFKKIVQSLRLLSLFYTLKNINKDFWYCTGTIASTVHIIFRNGLSTFR